MDMTKLKKFACLTLALIIMLPVFSGCSSGGTVTLRILHWADYMDETLLKDFEENCRTKDGKKISILFEVAEKPEVAAVKIEKGKESWDIMCPSESVLERLLKQNLLKPINTENMKNYNEHISPAMKEKSEAVEQSAKDAIDLMSRTDKDKYEKLFPEGFDQNAHYSVGYMWGNFGILYNTESMKDDMDLLNSWAALWDTGKFKGQMMMKNGPRESFAIGILYVYKDDLNKLYDENLNEYKRFLEEIYKISNGLTREETFNNKTYQLYKGNDLIAKVEQALKSQKETANPVYEMDDGKDAMVNGEYAMDMAWNGDGVWARGEIKALYEKGTIKNPDLLDYIIPKEGSNFWIDSWVIPKYSKNQEVAEMFIDFLCEPGNSIRNMEYVGYTSVNSSKEILSWAILNSGNFDNPIDVSYFFGEINNSQLKDEEDREIWYDYNEGTKSFTTFAYKGVDNKLYNRETDNLIENSGDFQPFLINTKSTFVNDIQYPSQEEYDRCGVMLGYSDYSDEILEMWTRVKGARLPVYVIVGLSILLTAAVTLGIIVLIRNRGFNKKIKTTTKKQTTPKKV